MTTEVYAELRITSQTLTPAQISSHTGLEADKVWKKGEQRGSYEDRPVFEKENRWVVRSTLAKTEPLEVHVADLSRRVMPFVENIRALADENVVSFTCVIYADSEEDFNQEVFLPRETVNLVSALGANFWADVYFLATDETS